eukprot:gnl/MRDRNA2_/MRDRNA2_130875_c0_seq1.p1 gnl/MRDRNA2_/MRDRNA2_130875_c0~~gnl/MRDRNA2_/MRDRNA2_130875_c0_seq1.p1  ORF type:complete len:302 (-),score=39.99 gnl/MRDRNA2_/MRDRNA2_130875_c0_seq1:41-946(-)
MQMVVPRSQFTDIIHVCIGACLASFAFGMVWLRRYPPLWSWKFMIADVRRSSWDRKQSLRELSARSRRRRLRLVLIRHGQSLANQNTGIIGGRDVKVPLTDKGENQSHLLGLRLHREGMTFDSVFASHAVRARRTAEIACNELGFPIDGIQEERRVVEFSQGELEKQPRKEVYRPNGPVMKGILEHAMFYRPPGFSPDGDRGESQHDVECRFTEFVDELLQLGPGELPQTDHVQTVAVFSHGIAIRSFLRGVIGAGTKFVAKSELENTSITELMYDPVATDLGGWKLVRFNDAAHLSSVSP